MLQPAFLALDKPVGLRSTKCVEEVRRVLREAGHDVKVGHGGTLDSTASGLIVMLISSATRLSDIVMRMPKVYRTTVRLGAETTTCDFAGEEVFSSEWRDVDEDEIDLATKRFLGWRLQTPPKISAVHVAGRRAHEIFRHGGNPEIEPRAVFVESIERIGGISRDGELELLICCGKGAYIRSIARDLGRILGCGAHVAALTRERVGFFSTQNAVKLDAETTLSFAVIASALIPLSAIEDFLPTYALPDEDMYGLKNGIGAPFSHSLRRGFGKHPPNGAIAFISKDMLSIARLKPCENGLYAVPEINIFENAKLGENA
jgi:tRNA pseudouridine(55) synthase